MKRVFKPLALMTASLTLSLSVPVVSFGYSSHSEWNFVYPYEDADPSIWEYKVLDSLDGVYDKPCIELTNYTSNDKKIVVPSKSYKIPDLEYFKLDTDNYLNFLIANGLKITANITNYFGNDTFFGFPSYEILDTYMDNLLTASYNFFKSDILKGFEGKDKEKRCRKYSDNPPKRLIISLACFIIIAIILIKFNYR